MPENHGGLAVLFLHGVRASQGALAGVDVTLESGERIRAPLVIGADGVRSRIARALGLGEANFAGYIAYRLAECGCSPFGYVVTFALHKFSVVTMHRVLRLG